MATSSAGYAGDHLPGLDIADIALARESAGEPRPRPRSASSLWTGVAGIAAALAAIILLRAWLQPSWLKALTVLGAAAAAMLVVDVLFYRVQQNATTGLAQQPLRAFDPLRVTQKLV